VTPKPYAGEVAVAPGPITGRSGRMTRWTRLAVAVGAAVVLFGGLLISDAGGDLVSQTISNVGLCLAALSAAVACLVRACRTRSRLRLAWGLIGLGILTWAGGQLIWVYLESIRGDEVPFPSAADVGYMGLPPLVVVGLLCLPVAAQTLANRIRSVLDGLMIGASALMISWILVVAPTIEASGDSALALYISLWYPLGDVVVVTVVLFQLALLRHRDNAMGRPLLLVGIGIGIFCVADIGFAYLNLTGSYASGGVIDTFWFLGFAFILLAARMPIREQLDAPARQDAGDRQTLGVLLPYVAVVAALVTSTFWFATNGGGFPFISWTRSALILLMVGRQVLTLLENRGLTEHLKSRVAQVSASEQRFHALVQHSSDVVTVIDTNGVVLYQSESVRRVFGYSARTLTGRGLVHLLHPDSAARLVEALRTVAGRPYATTVVELTVPHLDGLPRQAEITVANLVDDPSVGGLVLNTRDISERKQLQGQLMHEAFHDTLTQLANRALFHERVAEALRNEEEDGSTVTVLFLDLDGFKEVNDSLGHAAGDQLLVEVADRLHSTVRPDDTVARFGGDEFAVLVHAPSRRYAEGVAERIVAAMDEPFLLGERELFIGASVGLACVEDDEAAASDAEQLMRDADLAMYRAKALGGGGWAAYDPEMHASVVARLELEADLRRALDRREISLHYQPLIDLADSRIVGFEALVRWHHPVRGLVTPAEFIPVAEATGLIVPLGRWVLTEACRQAVAWSAETGGYPLKMSVNVSVRQFDRADLPAAVAEVLMETGMPAGQLCLEMTESVLMKDTEENLAQLIRLKALGVQLAIDDFGTGYSSLAYLRRFPVDIIKIDRSFVEQLGVQADDATLARTIVQLGQSLGISTVAEGIEQVGQLTALRRMGCGLAQGFYFSRPVPADEAGRLLIVEAGRLLVEAADQPITTAGQSATVAA
jgi:diguanylate cyclase (GGDEF)-like protein/PAS domain S-box-containing protein